MIEEGRVLIVDDDPALLQGLSETLRLRMPGLAVETDESAPRAIDRLATNDYDAVVADIKMPDMDGIELLGRIRELRPDTPTLLITGHGEHALAVEALRGGAHDYVQKPIDRDYFVGSLRHAIERSRLSRTVAEHRRRLQEQALELEACLEERTRELRELYRREALARAELEKSNAELDAAQRRRLELMSVIAHELATPLTTLRGYAELLTRPTAGPALRDRAKTIFISETRRMERLVQDLVADTGSGSPPLPLRQQQCDLVAIVREQVEAASAHSKRQRIVLEAPERLECYCDGIRIAQVVANLLNNAIKYAPRGDLQVRVWRDGRRANVSVRDQGPGIPAESLRTIFEPRIRLEPPKTGVRRSRAPDGAGLGLSIARDVVEAHHGRLWAESTLGDGATFTLSIPIRARPSESAATRKARSRRAEP